MYGIINNSLKAMLQKNYGKEFSEKVFAGAGLDTYAFVSNEPYDDALTYKLFSEASKLIDEPIEEILFSFGKYWILETASKHYKELLESSGENLLDFFKNLPSFHARVILIYPGVRPPTFLIKELASNQIELTYQSERPGLRPFVLGLIAGLGEYYNVNVKVVDQITKDSSTHIFILHWS